MASGGLPPGRRTGKTKWFNVVKGFGFITPDDGTQDVFVHQRVLQMQGFRSLAEEEPVEFESRISDKGVEATLVTGPGGADCKGSDRRPMPKKRFKKIRCYNCGDFGNHIAAKCPHGPLPKRCHHCKAEDHLVADCPLKENSKKEKDNGNNNDSPGPSNSGSSYHGPGPGPGGPGPDSGDGASGTATIQVT